MIIDLPMDMQRSLIKYKNSNKPLTNISKYNYNSKNINNIFIEISELISKSKKPLILAGNGIYISESIKEFRSFIEKCNIPVGKVSNYLKGVKRILKDNGLFTCTTPQNILDNVPVVTWHEKEYSLAEFKKLLSSEFNVIKIYGSKNSGEYIENEYGNNIIGIY